jgi:hypothetical protein
MTWPRPLSLLGSLALLILAIGSCGEDPTGDPFLPPNTPENILRNLELAYRLRLIEPFAELLSEDFQFYADEEARTLEGLPFRYSRIEEIAATEALFSCPGITKVRLSLRPRRPVPVNELGKESWWRVTAWAHLEVDRDPGPGESETTTYRVLGLLGPTRPLIRPPACREG